MLFNSYFSLLLAGCLHPESAKAWVLSLPFSTGKRSRTEQETEKQHLEEV